jgi:hypothetical protein
MRRIVVVSIAALLLVGCGPKRAKTGVVSGTVTYKGQPVNGAALLLFPTAGSQSESITIPVNQEGAFRIADVPAGEYKVVVQGTAGASEYNLKNMPPAKAAEAKAKLDQMKTAATIRFPDKYKSHLTTDLRCTVTDKDQTLDLPLKD